MRKLTASEAKAYLAKFDRIANTFETQYESLGLSKRKALAFAYEVDKIADEIAKSASLLEGGKENSYTKEHFSAGLLEGGDGAPYMKMYNDTSARPSNNAGSVVTKRKEGNGAVKQASSLFDNTGRYVPQLKKSSGIR